MTVRKKSFLSFSLLFILKNEKMKFILYIKQKKKIERAYKVYLVTSHLFLVLVIITLVNYYLLILLYYLFSYKKERKGHSCMKLFTVSYYKKKKK